MYLEFLKNEKTLNQEYYSVFVKTKGYKKRFIRTATIMHFLIILGLENVKNSGITKYYFQSNTNKKSQEAMTPPGF
ncbi:MAG: hypothetical protein IPG55_00190 [Saprospiraceae bacterium]|nr:hypothetical protein [Candidatus Defluviibacterium haderslevense]